MAELSVDQVPAGTVEAGRQRPRFFLGLTIIMAAIIFFGFGMTYFLPIATGSLEQPIAPIIHLHGLFYFIWMIWLVSQSSLAVTGRVALHRSMGMLGIAFATGTVLTGAIATVVFVAKFIDDPAIYGLNYISYLAVFGFMALFWVAIAKVRDSEAHKRLVILASMTFVIGGLNRIFLGLFGIDVDTHMGYLPRYLTVDVLIAAMLIYDWKNLGRIHGATVLGAAVNVIPQILHVPIVESGWFIALTHWTGSLAYY